MARLCLARWIATTIVVLPASESLAQVNQDSGERGPPAPPSTPAPSDAAADSLSVAPPQVQAFGRALMLKEALRVALRQQPQILAAQAQTNVSDAEVAEARAPLLPQLSGTASYSYGTLHQVSSASTMSTSASAYVPTNAATNYISVGAAASQLLFDFGQSTGRYSAAKKNRDATRITEETTRVQVLLNVRRAYFTARANRELVDVARQTLDDQNKHLTQVQGFVAAGTQPQIALAQQKAAVANAQVQLITAQNSYDTARAQLNQAAGIPGGTDYDVVDDMAPSVDDEEQPLETLVSRAVAQRPEIASLVKQREAQADTISAARGGYAPTLTANGQVGEAGNFQGPPKSTGLSFTWGVGANATWPLFLGGLTQGQVRQAEAQLDYLDQQQNIEVLQVRLDVNSAQLAVRAAKATIASAQDAVTNAHEQLRLAEQRYATGVGSIIELDDAEVAYTTAAAQLVQARYQLASARAQFLAAMGRT